MHSPLTDNTFGWFPSILKCSKDVKVAGVFIVIFILTLAICLRNHQCSSVLTCSAQWSFQIPSYFHRCDSGCASRTSRRGRCLCGSWRTAQAPTSRANSGIQPLNPNLKEAGNSSHFPFTGWQTGMTSACLFHRMSGSCDYIEATCLDCLKASNWQFHFEVFKSSHRQSSDSDPNKPLTCSHKY